MDEWIRAPNFSSFPQPTAANGNSHKSIEPRRVCVTIAVCAMHRKYAENTVESSQKLMCRCLNTRLSVCPVAVSLALALPTTDSQLLWIRFEHRGLCVACVYMLLVYYWRHGRLLTIFHFELRQSKRYMHGFLCYCAFGCCVWWCRRHRALESLLLLFFLRCIFSFPIHFCLSSSLSV